MRVLMTGFSARSVGSTKVRYDYTTLPAIYRSALEDLGHEVTMRAVVPGETLDEFDHALVLVNWISSLSTPHSASSALGLSQLGDRATLYVDDWRSGTVGDDIYSHSVVDKGWDHHASFRRSTYERLTPAQRDTVREVFGSIGSWPVLLARYDWGQLPFFVGKTPLRSRVVHVDPTAITPAPPLSERARVRAWSLATFQDPARQIRALGDLEWPIIRHGGDKKLPGGGSIDKFKAHPVVGEAELLREYAVLRGMIVPDYPVVRATGWWRVRYVHCLASGCIALAPAADGRLMGGAFDLPAAAIEAMDDRQLDYLAAAQRGCMEDWTWPKSAVMERLDRLVRGQL